MSWDMPNLSCSVDMVMTSLLIIVLCSCDYSLTDVWLSYFEVAEFKEFYLLRISFINELYWLIMFLINYIKNMLIYNLYKI